MKKLARIEASSICRQQFANVFADCLCAVHTHQLEFTNTSLQTLVCRVKAALEPKSYTDCILDEIEDIVKFDTANLCAEDLNEKVVEQNVHEKLIEWCEASRVHRNISIVEKRKESRTDRIIYVLTSRGQSAYGVNGQRSVMK